MYNKKTGKIAFAVACSLFCCAANANGATVMPNGHTAMTLAQDTGTPVKISTTIVDESGEPIVGAYITVKNTKNSAVTDINGKAEMTVGSTDAMLHISSLGYEPVDIAASALPATLTLREANSSLQEVVVVGYGSLQKKEVTSSITSIKGSDLTPGIGGSTVAMALRGKISGMTISGTSSPNSSNGFQLRGVASINASKGPLVVIDGIPGGDIRAINQEDIESIDVLKDASAGAIYGTRAAGGVILVTTKAAKSGKIKASYTAELSKDWVRKRPEVLSAADYVANGLGTDYGYSTDWYDELVNHKALTNRHVVSLTGGTDNLALYSSFSYANQEGIVIGDNRKDYSGRMNATYRMFDGRVKITANGEYRETVRDQRNSSDMFSMALGLNPTAPLMNPDNPTSYNQSGNGISGTDYNPVADIELQDYNGKDNWIIASAALDVRATDDLTLHAMAGYQKSSWQVYNWVKPEHRESIDASRNGKAYHGFSKDFYNSYEAYATYTHEFGRHSLKGVAGWSFWESNGESFNMTNYNFPVAGIGPWDMGSGSYLTDGRASMGSNKDPRERLMAFFGRANWSYADRYMAMASIRREGSSKFSASHRWGTFWALSAGWRLSNEAFMKDISWVDDLKLRVGYGVTGNNGFGSGYTVKTYKSDQMWPVNGAWTSTYGISRNINENLKWEQKTEWNVGLDYSLLDNRIYGSFDWYYRRVNDLLYSVGAPMPPMVYNTMMKNVGSLENKGWELEVGADIIRKDNLTLSSKLRLSHNSSRLLNMGLDKGSYIDEVTFPSPGNPGQGARLMNDVPIGQFFCFKYAGLTDEGNWLIYDKDNNVVEANDKTLVTANKHFTGNAIPKLILGWDNSVRYKNFDASVSLRSWIDFDIFSQTNMYFGLKNKSQLNMLKSAYAKNKNINAEKILCDYFIEDGSFLKIDAITLGYRFDMKNTVKGLDNIRLYCTLRDLAVITGYSGTNPEVNINGLTPGFEYIKDTASMYPQTSRVTVGLQFNL